MMTSSLLVLTREEVLHSWRGSARKGTVNAHRIHPTTGALDFVHTRVRSIVGLAFALCGAGLHFFPCELSKVIEYIE
jgi:hypothetical protein